MTDTYDNADAPKATVPDTGGETQPIQPDSGFQPHIESPVASKLAVWIWILSVFAFFPLLGLVPAIALAVGSVVLLARRGPYAWDRRIGTAGLALSLASFGVVAAWITMVLVSEQFDPPDPGSFDIPRERSWQVAAMQILVLVVSIVLHECAHGVAAYWSGDGTAARQGRIRLNPLVHVDPFGSVILPAILIMVPGGVVFGWAKPVPIDRRQFRSHRRGLLAVTLAGVSINMLLALACTAGLLAVGSALRLAHPSASSEGFMVLLHEVELQGVPGAGVWELGITALKQGILVNLVLFTFNILPIPPLDGYGVLESLAPSTLSRQLTVLRPVGTFVLLGLIVLGMVTYLLLPAVVVGIILNILVGVLTGWG